MANCNDLFLKFLSEISIEPECSKNLQRGREAIKREIEDYFSNKLKVGKPDFYLQGSYSLKTMVEPLNPEVEYDLDDGIYLRHTDNDISKPTTEEVSSWIFKAVEGHTKKKPKNKKNCIRVIYAEGYHIDLAIYRKIDGEYYLARLGEEQWVPSDARAFNNWFYTRLEKNEQMRSCIKYIKAWMDYNGSDLKGIHITSLVGRKHVAVEGRDDESLTKTLAKIIEYLEDKGGIYNPIDETENLIADWATTKLIETIKALKGFRERATEALGEDDKKEAAELWQRAFGDRFEFDDEENGRDRKRVAPTIVNPKPWSCL